MQDEANTWGSRKDRDNITVNGQTQAHEESDYISHKDTRIFNYDFNVVCNKNMTNQVTYK